MNQATENMEEAPAPVTEEQASAPMTEEQPPAQAGKGTRVGASIVAILLVVSLLWYFIANRLTPYTSQARVQAFVVPVAAEVAGKVLKVNVRNNDEVQPEQVLFEIDPGPYRIALQRARSDFDAMRYSVNAGTAAVEAARASLQAAQANRDKADKDATRQERLYAEDPGTISVRRLEGAQATRIQARAQEKAAEADLRRAQEMAGASGNDNAQLISARSAVEKAELDLARTRVLAPGRGLVTDLRIDVGHFAQAGAPAMTFIASHDLWINAEMTENNLGNVEAGDEVAIVFDVLPGEVFKGRIRSVGHGVSSGEQTQPGTLPTVQNSRDWLRQSQRFPVQVEIDPSEQARLHGVRVGGQAEVLVYTGDNPVMNFLGAAYIRLMSYLSYLY
jgi:multidrug resistance efflux pump